MHPVGAATQSDDAPLVALTDVAIGRRALFSLVGSADGFRYVLNRSDASGEDPRRDADGMVREVGRVCGTTEPIAARLERRLALHLRPEFDHVPLRCEGLTCTASGPMEFATTLRFVFARDGDGRLGLTTVYEVEDVGLTPEAVESNWTRAEVALADAPWTCADLPRR